MLYSHAYKQLYLLFFFCYLYFVNNMSYKYIIQPYVCNRPKNTAQRLLAFLTFMSMIHFVLSCVEHEKSCYNFGAITQLITDNNSP